MEPRLDWDGSGAVLQARRRPANREYTVGIFPQLPGEDRQSLPYMDPPEVRADSSTKQSNIRMNLTALRAARYPARYAEVRISATGKTLSDFPHASGHDRKRFRTPTRIGWLPHQATEHVH